MRNKSSLVDKQGTEVRFALPSTDKKLWPLRYALISCFCVMLKNSGNGNTLKIIQKWKMNVENRLDQLPLSPI